MDLNLLYLTVAELAGLLAVAAYFSASETAVMALNRHRLQQWAQSGRADAGRVLRLLSKPDRFIALMLLGNHFAKVLLIQVATLTALQWWVGANLLLTTASITLILVVFGEVLPKTLGAIYPERVAYPAARLLGPLMRVFQPLIMLLNATTQLLLAPCQRGVPRAALDLTEREELRTALQEAGAMIPQKHRDMLVGLLDLENVTVEDIMVPRTEIVAIDLDKEWLDVVDQLTTCRHTRVPCYHGNLDDTAGILPLRNLSRLLRQSRDFTLADLEGLLVPAHFVPLGANLYTQLINFQLARQRLGLVVDEYGDIAGMVTLDDLLEQVVGEFTAAPQFGSREVSRQADGSFVVEGSANVRELNRGFGWSLPERGPKTLNGLILEALEDIPEAGTSFRLGDYTIEIVQGSGHTVRNARIFPPAGLTRGPRATRGDGARE